MKEIDEKQIEYNKQRNFSFSQRKDENWESKRCESEKDKNLSPRDSYIESNQSSVVKVFKKE